MKYRIGVLLAIVVSASAVWSALIIENGSETAPDPSAFAQIDRMGGDGVEIAVEASAVPTDDPEGGDRVVEAPVGDGAGAAESSLAFGRASPAEIENAVYQRIAEQLGLRLTNLTSVECDTLRCRIVFTGVDANPRYVGEYGELLNALMRPPWNNYQPTQGNIGTREMAPGAREYVLELTYVALVDASEDPQVAAHQYAACAGAWARVTELRRSDDYIQMAREQASKYLELAARELGRNETQRLAEALKFGPLTRECHAMPY